MLIGIAGKAGAGKDTAAEWFVDNQKYEIQHLADPIKDMLSEFYGKEADWQDRDWKETIDPFWGFSPRQAAQKLGTEWRDSIDPTKLLWCNWMEKDWGDYSFDPSQTVVPDIRFLHEQDWVHSHGGIVICIHRHDISEVAAHSSENSLDPAKVDINIMNTSTIEDLHLELSRMWDYIMNSTNKHKNGEV